MVVSLPWASGWFRRQAHRPAAYLNILLTLLAFVHGSLILQEVFQIGPVDLTFPWLSVADLELDISFSLTLNNLVALELITGLSLLSQVYSLGYMDKEWALARFFALLGFFEGAMSGVVLSDSLFQSYFLLEMLTLSTYLLVGFWYAQPLVVTAARDAFLTKRVGDVLLLMGVVALCSFSGVMGFTDLYAWAARDTLTPLAATLLGLGLIAGPTGKYAQFPMHLWLDEAMEGLTLLRSAQFSCGDLWCHRAAQSDADPAVLMTLVVLLLIGGINAIGVWCDRPGGYQAHPVVFHNGPSGAGLHRHRPSNSSSGLAAALHPCRLQGALIDECWWGDRLNQLPGRHRTGWPWQPHASHHHLLSGGCGWFGGLSSSGRISGHGPGH